VKARKGYVKPMDVLKDKKKFWEKVGNRSLRTL